MRLRRPTVPIRRRSRLIQHARRVVAGPLLMGPLSGHCPGGFKQSLALRPLRAAPDGMPDMRGTLF